MERTKTLLIAVATIGICSVLSAQEREAVKCGEEVRARLTPEQYRVACQSGTERPFHNPYWDNHEPGLYVDVVTGAPLFSSNDKFDSGTGWPSFTKPVEPGSVVTSQDKSLMMNRTEVRSSTGGTHLGHLFDDGPAPTGQRYCVNSASLRFIPLKDLKKAGYGKYESAIQAKKP